MIFMGWLSNWLNWLYWLKQRFSIGIFVSTRFLFQAAEAERLKRVEQQRKELLEKVFIEQIRKQKEVQAEQYYQQQNQLLQLQRLHQLKLMQDDLHHGSASNGRANTSALDAALASRAAAAGIPITISSGVVTNPIDNCFTLFSQACLQKKTTYLSL